MKNLLCTIMLITIPCFCYCQTKVNGLGVFQIGLPLVEFSTIITPIYGTPKHIKDEDTYYKVTEGHVYIVDSLEYVSHVIPKYDLCENIILYYFPKLNIGNNSFEKVTIEFYHDSLNKICIEGKTTELENAIEAVYGKGTVVFHEPEIACVYQLTGANFKKKGFDSKTTYRNDKKNILLQFFQ